VRVLEVVVIGERHRKQEPHVWLCIIKRTINRWVRFKIIKIHIQNIPLRSLSCQSKLTHEPHFITVYKPEYQCFYIPRLGYTWNGIEKQYIKINNIENIIFGIEVERFDVTLYVPKQNYSWPSSFLSWYSCSNREMNVWVTFSLVLVSSFSHSILRDCLTSSWTLSTREKSSSYPTTWCPSCTRQHSSGEIISVLLRRLWFFLRPLLPVFRHHTVTDTVSSDLFFLMNWKQSGQSRLQEARLHGLSFLAVLLTKKRKCKWLLSFLMRQHLNDRNPLY